MWIRIHQTDSVDREYSVPQLANPGQDFTQLRLKLFFHPATTDSLLGHYRCMCSKIDMSKKLFNYWLKAVLHHRRMLMHATS